MSHVVLLGDSIFDNAAYVRGGPDVIAQLRGRLPEGWQATLRAVDGSVLADVHQQLERLPVDASHLILSAGGNDAIGHAGILAERAQSTAEVLGRLADISADFEKQYERLLRSIVERGRPAAVCTIYYPRFPEASLQRIAVAALATFNDVIIRQAFVAGLPLLDLRLICNQPADYANEIEPSTEGGEKITRSIVQLLTEHDFETQRTQVFI